jgi:hypothetical protein
MHSSQTGVHSTVATETAKSGSVSAVLPLEQQHQLHPVAVVEQLEHPRQQRLDEVLHCYHCGQHHARQGRYHHHLDPLLLALLLVVVEVVRVASAGTCRGGRTAPVLQQ